MFMNRNQITGGKFFASDEHKKADWKLLSRSKGARNR